MLDVFGPYFLPPIAFLLYKYLPLNKTTVIGPIGYCVMVIVFMILGISFVADLIDLLSVVIFIILLFYYAFFLLKIRNDFLKGLILGLVIFGYYLLCIFWTIGAIAGIPDYVYRKEYSHYKFGIYNYSVVEKNYSTPLNHNRYFAVCKGIKYLPFEKVIVGYDAMELYFGKKPIIVWVNQQNKLVLKIGFEKDQLSTFVF